MFTDDVDIGNDGLAYQNDNNVSIESEGDGGSGGSDNGGSDDGGRGDGGRDGDGRTYDTDNAAAEISSKQRIVNSAAAIFATKGFTETTIRELASAAGLKASSIYNHFSSKTAILEYILDDYVEHNSGTFFNETTRQILEKDPTTDGIIACHQVIFSGEKVEYYFNVLSMTLQEQHRNPVIREYIQNDILKAENHVEIIINVLKQLGILKLDTDPDYWKKMISSVFYTFSNRAVLGNGDSAPGYTGMDMEHMLRQIYEDLLSECGVNSNY